MIVMGLDTALHRCSVAILDGDHVLADHAIDLERGHAERLAPMVTAALGDAGIGVNDLQRVGVVVGPGGFTGVRVGLSFARGLGIGTDLDVVGVTSLAALAQNISDAKEADLIGSVIDARGGQVYTALYNQNGETLMAPVVASPKDAAVLLNEKAHDAKTLLVGSGANLIAALPGDWSCAEVSTQIDSKHVARIAARRPRPEGPPPPLYLRPPDAKPPKPNRFQKLASS